MTYEQFELYYETYGVIITKKFTDGRISEETAVRLHEKLHEWDELAYEKLGGDALSDN